MRSMLGMLALAAATAACGFGAHDGDAGDPGVDATDTTGSGPRVISSVPADTTTNVPLDERLTATFSEAMDPSTLTGATFTLHSDHDVVAGSVSSTSTSATFEPSGELAPSTTYVATITIGATNTAAIAMAAPFSWTFQTGTNTTALGAGIDLGTAGTFVLLGKTGITNLPTSVIVGDIGVSPVTSTAITGFALTPDVSTQFATTPEVTGKVYAADLTSPTAAKLTVAIGDMQTAFTVAAGRAPDVTELGAGTIGSITLPPGVYKWSSSLLIPTAVTLDGSATDVWIFQIAQDLSLYSNIVLSSGASARHVFWQVSGAVVVHTGAHLEGTVLSQTAAILDTGATLHGRLLAQTLVTIRGATITLP